MNDDPRDGRVLSRGPHPRRGSITRSPARPSSSVGRGELDGEPLPRLLRLDRLAKALVAEADLEQGVSGGAVDAAVFDDLLEFCERLAVVALEVVGLRDPVLRAGRQRMLGVV